MKRKFDSNKRTRGKQKYCPNCGQHVRNPAHNFMGKGATPGQLVFTCIGVLNAG